MISQNYSHDSKVWTKEYDNDGNLIRDTGKKNKDGVYIYDNLPDYTYIHIEFDNFKYLRDPQKPSAKAVKTKVGKIVCCWAQLPHNQKSIMPSILEELLRARSDTRKMIKTESDPFMQNILDKRQLGYKVTANSLYGQCGARTSTFYEKDVAASTTATGRMMITYAKEIVEKVYQMEYETESHGVVKMQRRVYLWRYGFGILYIQFARPRNWCKNRGQKSARNYNRNCTRCCSTMHAVFETAHGIEL
jgi:hypothetical protein